MYLVLGSYIGAVILLLWHTFRRYPKRFLLVWFVLAVIGGLVKN